MFLKLRTSTITQRHSLITQAQLYLHAAVISANKWEVPKQLFCTGSLCVTRTV